MEERVGPTIGIVILIILVAIGGIYFFYKEDQRFHTPPVQETVNA
jgi:hypothetical protein